jgi:hypothetical protein
MTAIRSVTARAAAVAIGIVLLAPAVRAEDHPLIQAMRDEIARAMAGLRLPGQPAPYFIACTIDDGAGRQISATGGATVSDGRNRSRVLRVDVRVGDYARDSSRFVSFDRDPGVMSMYAGGSMQAPLDENIDVVRRQLWLVIDGAYRRALSSFAKKQAAQQNQATPDPVPDWSRETPRTTLLPAVTPAIALDPWVAHARALSAALARPGLTRSEVAVGGMQGTRYFVTSEGTTAIAPLQAVSVRLTAETQAADGMPLRDTVVAHARTVAGLPSVADLTASAKAITDGLLALKEAPVGEAYTGPVLVEGQASAELLAQTLVPLFAPQRAPEMENPQMFGPAGRPPASPFLTRVGSRVLPEAFSVSDTPSLAAFEGREVAGAYAVDDEGVPAQDVTLCEKGMLKTLLTGRTPQKGFLTSNGHGRGGRAMAGVFQLQSSSAVPAKSLKAKYLEKLKADGREFGYIVRSLATASNPSNDPEDMMTMAMAMRSGPSGPEILRAYKVAPDGTETLVRGLQFATVPHAAFKDVLEASQERALYSYRSSLTGMMQMASMIQGGPGAGDAVVSLIVPHLIFGELEIEKPDRPFQRPPIVPAPQP